MRFLRRKKNDQKKRVIGGKSFNENRTARKPAILRSRSAMRTQTHGGPGAGNRSATDKSEDAKFTQERD